MTSVICRVFFYLCYIKKGDFQEQPSPSSPSSFLLAVVSHVAVMRREKGSIRYRKGEEGREREREGTYAALRNLEEEEEEEEEAK